MDKISTYQQWIDADLILQETLERKRKVIPLSRLGSFLGLAAIVYWITLHPGFLSISPFCLVLAVFITLGIIDFRLKKRIDTQKQKVLLHQAEINSIRGDQSAFDPGAEFINPEHFYTHDLDIFGRNSLFQMINRTATIFGKTALAGLFENAYRFRNEIRSRQEAVAELAANPGFRQKLRLIFYGTESRQSDRDNMLNWVINKNTQFSSKVLWFASYFAPAITIGTIIAAIAGSIGPELPGLLFLGQLFFVGIFGKQTMRIQRDITQQYDVIRKYSEFLKLIESEPFTSPLLVNIRESLQNEGHEPPSKIIGSLAKLLNWLDSNLNLLVSILLNGLFMFNLHILFGIERWKNRNAGQIEKWFQAMACIDAFASLGNFSFNNPGFIFPEPVEGTFTFTASDLGHPLIEPGKCVTNNIQIGGWNQFCIITGANMSGKSTFLRTLGTNLVLAMAGAPVYASRMQFTPIQIHSSIRTSDSLAKKESYFYAELKRLKEIITGLQAGEVKLILIDEVLKGTNSRDKQSGSIALIRQLLKYKSVGMFATHDLILGELQQEYPENVQNLCFEINIEGEEMVIDYKIRPGVCKNLNATFLMRQMGIIKE